jgi:hypothetical protein
MTPYENCLLAIERLLSTVGVNYWADWIRRDIQDWQNSRDTSHHLSAYGGMGSFNDIWICRENSHNVTEPQEPWVQSLFEWLKAVAFYLAEHPQDEVSAQELQEAIGCYDSVLAAFVGGRSIRADARGFADRRERLNGWRCLQCGYSEVTDRDLERYIAQNLVPGLVFEACERLALDQLVQRLLALEIERVASIRDDLVAAVAGSGITFLKRKGWMQPCSRCGAQNTGVFRWRLTAEKPPRFEPSDDNLPVIERITE